MNAVKKAQIWALNIVTIYHWKRDQGVHFHLNYISENPNEKVDFRGMITVPFFNMKEDLAPAVMHMHEIEASWMKDSNLPLKMVSVFHMLWKNHTHQDTEQKAKETFASSFYAYRACHISV